VDNELGDRIRVTVIATGFQSESQITPKTQEQKIHDLDRSQGWLFTPDNSVNENNDFEVRQKTEIKPDAAEEKPMEREMIFTGPFNKIEDPVQDEEEDMGEESLLHDDDFNDATERYGDQVVSEDGMMELRSTKQRLQQQAEQRKETLKQTRKHEMTKEEFNEKWALPAYLRRGVSMQDVPHSSQSFISKYNLNDDNNILGNNKFLHDNVD
jgi:cell division protein FtsZ